MSKTMCEKGMKGGTNTSDPSYICKKCGALVKKEKEVCKPRKFDNKTD